MKILDVPQSGSIAGQTSSHNRFGQYRRTRAIPVNPASAFQGVARARLANLSAAWRDLTSNQRAGWSTLGLSMTRTDSLGQTITLDGKQAYVSVNSVRLAAGDAIVDDAPGLSTPESLVTATITLNATTMSIAYTITPLAAGQRLFAFASPQVSAGRAYNSDFRLIQVSAAAAASPLAITTAYEARLGDLVVGNRVFFSLQVYDGGFLSGPLYTSAVVA